MGQSSLARFRSIGFSLVDLAIVALALAACGDNISDPNDVRGPAIVGSVWHDQNGDNLFSPGENALAGRTIFLDTNANELFDGGEPSATTDESGAYKFTDLEPGPYQVRQVMEFGWRGVFEATGTSAIIGGVDAAATEYPFMASVGFIADFGDGPELFEICGGVLVSDRFVVTAAHCSEGVDPAGAGVLLGTNDLLDPNAQLFETSGIVIHPSYDGDVENGFDIAVWQLATRIDLEQRDLRTVELLGPGTAALAEASIVATTAGWGTSDNASPLLQQVHVPIVDESECAAAYPRVDSLETQICAGVAEGGVDSCQGDSGGPLLVRDPVRNTWLHAGVTSWGDGCALPGLPGVYARTSTLSEWAEAQMIEPSRVFRIGVTTDPITVDFGNQETVRPTDAAIEPRWQLTNVSIEGAPDGIVAANTPLTVRYGLVDELPARALACVFDPDGDGPQMPQSVLCQAGAGQLTTPGYVDGVYRATFEASDAKVTHTRSPLLIAGSPTLDSASGELAAGDQLDPDFNDPYFIDYYELTGTTDGALTLIDVTTSDFSPFFVLYDADMRTQAGGGTISIGARLELRTEPGKRYWVGVSTFNSGTTGSYDVALTNNGTLVPVTL